MPTANESETESDKAVAVTREKPLNQTQLKNLRELVSGDFADLHQEVYAEIERRHRAKINEIEERYKDMANLDKARKELRDDMAKTYERLVAKVQKVLDKDGFTAGHLSAEGLVAVSIKVDSIVQDGKDEEIRKANEAKYALEMAAKRVLNREQRAVDRQCLLQGISAFGAHELIRDLPEAADILPLVSAEMQMKESEAMDLLMSDVKAAKAVEGGGA